MQIRLTLEQAKEQERQALYVTRRYTYLSLSTEPKLEPVFTVLYARRVHGLLTVVTRCCFTDRP